jgi:hypothetical protein
MSSGGASVSGGGASHALSVDEQLSVADKGVQASVVTVQELTRQYLSKVRTYVSFFRTQWAFNWILRLRELHRVHPCHWLPERLNHRDLLSFAVGSPLALCRSPFGQGCPATASCLLTSQFDTIPHKCHL